MRYVAAMSGATCHASISTLPNLEMDMPASRPERDVQKGPI